MPGKIETVIKDSPFGFVAPPTSFWFLASKQPPAEFCRFDLGGRNRNLRRRFSGLHKGGGQHFGCLTINFDDMRRILDIFSVKAMCRTT
jgi:hypothetical protein